MALEELDRLRLVRTRTGSAQEGLEWVRKYSGGLGKTWVGQDGVTLSLRAAD